LPYKSKRHYREIGFRHDHSKWLDEQAGGPRGVSRIVEKCIERVMKHTDAADRLDQLEDQVVSLKASLAQSNQRLDKIAAFLEFQVWVGVGRNEASFDKWHNEFSEWQKEEVNANQ